MPGCWSRSNGFHVVIQSRRPLPDIPFSLVALLCLLSGTIASSGYADSAPAAVEIAPGKIELKTMNGGDDSQHWLKCHIAEPGRIQAMVDAPARRTKVNLEWTLFSGGSDGTQPGEVLDQANAMDRRFSQWLGVQPGWIFLRVRAGEGQNSEMAYKVGFDFQPATGDLQQLLSVNETAQTPTRFRDSHFNNVTQVSAVLYLMEAKLERDTFGNWDIEGEHIYFQIYRDGGWQTLPEDGVTTTTQWTDNNGIGRSYLLVPDDLAAGNYSIRAVYDGSAEYGATSRTATLTIEWPVSYIIERHAHVNGSGRIPLVLVHGNGGEESDNNEGPWTTLLDYMDNHPSQFPSVDPYVWKHNTKRAVGFDGSSNAGELANVIYNYILPDYPPGTKVVIMAHSRGGMVSRSFMNYNRQGDDVAGLITLGTPHHGSPFAVPDWAAISWALKLGNSIASATSFNLLVGTGGKGFDTTRLGSLNLAWDNMDSVIQGWTKLTFDVSFASSSDEVKVSYRDMNSPSSFSDETILYSSIVKNAHGTLQQLNARESYYDRIVTVGFYDENISDNPNWNNLMDVLINAVGSVFSNHYALSGVTRLMSSMSEQVAFNNANYVANDGLVPLQSALLLNVSGGQSFASLGTDNAVSIDWTRINERKQVKKHIIRSGDNSRDHQDLIDSNQDSYWSQLATEIQDFAKAGLCLTPPDYNYYLYIPEEWTTTTSTSTIDYGCRVYKMYLWDDTAYDFSLCSSDGVSGFADPGDGDLEMYDGSGQSLWYIDGQGGCGWDASTLGTGYEGWTPPSTGWYYLRVSEYYDDAFSFRLACKGRIKRGSVQVTIEPETVRNLGAQWRLEGGEWHDSGASETELWIGNYAVEFKTVAGWVAPAGQQAQVVDQQVASVIGTYLPDCNNNGVPDGEDPDSDGDGVVDGCDQCPYTIDGASVDPFGCPLSPIADFDRDGDVDLDDFAYIQACLSGQGVPPAPGCDNADLERDQDVDTNDLALFEPCLSGANVPALPTCLGR